MKGTRNSRLLILAVAVVVILVIGLVLVRRSGSSSTPSAKPGTILSSTPISGAPPGSNGWRITYRTTTASGEAAESTGTVYVPTTPAPAGGRLVVAWAHPTVGMGQDCTPSQAADPSASIPGFAQMIANGWVIASTDYIGLGTTGVLPYLVGAGEARNVLDSVRAARELPGTEAGRTFAVWGHSQGGHASLFVADEAAAYAPELTLVGVAAAAPAAEMPSLVALQWQSAPAWIIGAEVVTLWPQFYPSLEATQVTSPVGLQNAAAVGGACITSDPTSFLAQFASLLAQPFFMVDPITLPDWRAAFETNTPTPRAKVPVFIGQGQLDDVVLPATTAQLEQQWCARGSAITVDWYPTATHFSIPTVSAPDAMTWIGQRFADQAAGNTCTQTSPVTPATEPPRAS
jgi:pimeloyl-ACP methyl ester carboxylesterase